MRDINSIKQKQIVFLTGSSRSGTTLLSNILNSHDNIISCPENGFITSHIASFGKKKSLTPRQIDRFVDHLWIRKRFMKATWNLDEAELKQRLKSIKSELNFETTSKVIYDLYGKNKKNPKLYIDKGPSYLRNIKKINRTFDEPKYIVIIRDYRDRYVSLKKLKKNSPLKLLMVRGISWVLHQKNALKFKKLHSDRIHLIKYEELISSPEKCLRALCNFVEVDFSQNLLHHDNYMSIQYKAETGDDRMQHFESSHIKSSSKIDRTNFNKYLTDLSLKEIAQLDFICAKTGAHFDYQKHPNTPALSIFRQMSMNLKLTFGKFSILPIRGFFLLPLRFQGFIINGMHKMLYSK
ncbi:MAG: hypothetical protein ACI9J3_000125 [Parvicellaceae bacterium]|jgi:hypothetical protein